MTRKRTPLMPNDPLRHPDHPRPNSRRDFLRYGFLAGAGAVMGSSVLGLFANPRQAYADLSPDLQTLRDACGIAVQGAGKIPFICFDLAGGASIAGSNVLVGGRGGQFDFLNANGYSRLGLPSDMVPSVPNAAGNDQFDTSMGLAFHDDSGFLRGINDKVSALAKANMNGALIPARSENDTGNNPHNPMYAINQIGADGELLTLIGSRNSDSGGNSMAPADLIDLTVRPTKVDRPSDVTGLVDTGKLVGLLSQSDAVAVMEAIQRISDSKMDRVNTTLGVDRDAVVRELVRCGYVKSADLVDRYGDPSTLNPELDENILGPTGIFSQAEWDGPDGGEFRKTASVMKMVVNGFAGAGTITMGGYDYHTGDRAAGELRDLRAGRCMGACLEYAARVGVPLMLYVFSDGSVFSNGSVDESVNGRGKGVWTGDSQNTAASFFMVYNPNGRPILRGGADLEAQAMHQQLGFFRSDGSVETSATPAANNVNLLVNTVALNYMALHDDVVASPAVFSSALPNNGLGTSLGDLVAFEPIVNGIIGS